MFIRFSSQSMKQIFYVIQINKECKFLNEKSNLQFLASDSMLLNAQTHPFAKSLQMNKVYEKDYRTIQRQLFQFKLAYENRTLSAEELNAYHKNVFQLELMYNSFLKNTIAIMTQKQITETLRNLEFLIYDQQEKNRSLLKSYNQSEQKRLSEKKSLHTQKISTTCERCYENIRKVNVQEIKEYLENQYMGTLDRMILQAKMQINGQLFTEEEDQLFFKQLHNTLKKKHENIDFNNKCIEALINKVTKDISDLNLMKKMAIQEAKQPQSPSYQWMKNLQNSLNQLLQATFKKKIPIFLQSMLSSFETHFKSIYIKPSKNDYTQTDNYESPQLLELRQKTLKLSSLKSKLQSDIKWYEQEIKVKSSQMAEVVKKYQAQLQERFNELITQKQANKKMQYTIDLMGKQLSLVKEEIGKKTEKEEWFKKKISRVEKEKLQIQIQNIRAQAQKQYLTENSHHNSKEKEQHLQHQVNDHVEEPVPKIKSKKLISKLTIKESRTKRDSQQPSHQFKPNIENHQEPSSLRSSIKFFDKPTGIINESRFKDKVDSKPKPEENHKSDDEEQSEESSKVATGKSLQVDQDNKDFILTEKDQQPDTLNNQVSVRQAIPQNSNPSQKTLQPHQRAMLNDCTNLKQIKRVNELMEERLKQSGILFQKRSSKKSELFSKTYSKLSTQQNGQKQKTNESHGENSEFSASSKKLHFRSQTLLNNMKISHNMKGVELHDFDKPLKSKNKSNVKNLLESARYIDERSEFDHVEMKRSKRRKFTEEPKKSRRVTVSSLGYDISEMVNQLRQRFFEDKKTYEDLLKKQQNNQVDEQIKSILVGFLAKHGLNLEDHHIKSQKKIQIIEGQNEQDTKIHTNFQRKANKSVSFFKENQYVNLDEGTQQQLTNKPSHQSEQKPHISFVQKKFPIVYKSCFNTPNMLQSNCLLKHVEAGKGGKTSKDKLRKIAWRSLPNEVEEQLRQSESRNDRKLRSRNQPKKLQQIKNSGHKHTASNVIDHKPHRQSVIKVQIFTKQDFDLFIDETNAYLYECNHMKSYHKKLNNCLSPLQHEFLSQIFRNIQSIKDHNNFFYEEIISFIRYPYQTIRNINWGACIIKGLKLQNFIKFFERILHLHKKCLVKGEYEVCQHLKTFARKIETVKKHAIGPANAENTQKRNSEA